MLARLYSKYITFNWNVADGQPGQEQDRTNDTNQNTQQDQDKHIFIIVT